jgi:large subunit ribosomal protein L4e
MAEKKPVKKRSAAKKAPAKAKAPAEGKVNVYGLDGKVKGQVKLPPVFRTEFRPDVIRRAVNAARANQRHPYGPGKKAGMRHAVSQWGKGRGTARVQRLTQGQTAAESPPNVGGRRAHPPRPERNWREKINKKEKALALRSAIAAAGNRELVRARGHKLDNEITVPLVMSDNFESMYDDFTEKYEKEGKRPAYTKEAVNVLSVIGLGEEMQRAKSGIHIRAGRGKLRGRKKKQPKSILFVVTQAEKTRKCLGNLPGVDIVTPDRLNVEMLAPGGDAGRLTLFTEKALASLGGE